MSATARSAASIEELRQQGMSFSRFTLGVSAAMAVFKITVGLLTGSHALLANALYSINDVLSSIAATVSLKIGRRSADDEYPFGYGKAEYVAVGMVSLAIAIGVLAMFFYSAYDILRGVEDPPHFLAIPLAALSFVVSWTLSKRGDELAELLRSPVLATTAAHQHADALGSIATIIGVAFAVGGFHAVDRVIALGETAHLIALSGNLLAKSFKGLMDEAVGEEDLELIELVCLDVVGVKNVSFIRSRRLGSLAWLDIGITVDSSLSVDAANGIRDRVHDAADEVLGEGIVVQVRTHGMDHAVVPVASGGSHHG